MSAYAEMNRLRELAPVQNGALGDLLGFRDAHFSHHTPGHPTFTAFSFAAATCRRPSAQASAGCYATVC